MRRSDSDTPLAMPRFVTPMFIKQLVAGIIIATLLAACAHLHAENVQLRGQLHHNTVRQLQERCPPCSHELHDDFVAPWTDANRSQALDELIAVSPSGYRKEHFGPIQLKRLTRWTRNMKLSLCVKKQGDPDRAKVQETVSDLETCARQRHTIDASSLTRERELSVHVNGKVLSVDDITYGMEVLFQQRHMHSQVTFMGVGMQQDPNDAIVIADLLWRVPLVAIGAAATSGPPILYLARALGDGVGAVGFFVPTREARRNKTGLRSDIYS